MRHLSSKITINVQNEESKQKAARLEEELKIRQQEIAQLASEKETAVQDMKVITLF